MAIFNSYFDITRVYHKLVNLGKSPVYQYKQECSKLSRQNQVHMTDEVAWAEMLAEIPTGPSL